MIRPVDVTPSQMFGDNPTSRILPGSPDYWIIEKFGNYQPDGHTGEDYPCPIGTPVRAVTAGTVLHIGNMGGTYADNPWWVQPSFAGYCAVIDHGSFIGIYGHCLDGSAGVAKGDRVAEGDVFIRSGNTGASTGAHLHFEILPDGYVLNSRMYGRTNPETLFTGIQAQGAITPQTTTTQNTTEEDELSKAAEEDIVRIRQILEAVETDRIRERIIALDDRTAIQNSKYLKGADEATLYELADGKLRGISLDEWQASGLGYRTLPQDIINALPRA